MILILYACPQDKSAVSLIRASRYVVAFVWCIAMCLVSYLHQCNSVWNASLKILFLSGCWNLKPTNKMNRQCHIIGTIKAQITTSCESYACLKHGLQWVSGTLAARLLSSSINLQPIFWDIKALGTIIIILNFLSHHKVMYPYSHMHESLED